MIEGSRDQLLFSYGSLLEPATQHEIFGRTLDGEMDVLSGWTVDYLDGDDSREVDGGRRGARPFVRRTGSAVDKVIGRAAAISDEELDAADLDANASFRRLSVVLASGRRAWVYLRP